MTEPATYLTVSLMTSGSAILHLRTHSVVCDNLDRVCEKIREDRTPEPVFLLVDEVFSEPWFYYLDQGEWYEIKGDRA